MTQFFTSSFNFRDPSVRQLEESDIPAVMNLFKLNYGDDYIFPDLYDDKWYKRGIYSDHIIWLVIQENDEIIASGSINLDYGGYNDQIGEIGKLVVNPRWHGKGFAQRMIDSLLQATDYSVDFAFGETRTSHSASQKLLERGRYAVAGFIPHQYSIYDGRESSMLYIKLYGNGLTLRSEAVLQIIPEVAPLARHVLALMGLPISLNVVRDCAPYEDSAICSVLPLDRTSLAKLARIEHGRLVEPLLFGGVTLDQGLSYIRRRNAIYLMAVDDNQNPVGALGYQQDETNRIVKGIELVAKDNHLRGQLCGSLLREAERLCAQVIEVNVSAYDARLQRTFADHGFHPVAYLPAMVFHGTSRLDVVKMLKLNVPYERGEMKLTESAKAVVEIVEQGFL